MIKLRFYILWSIVLLNIVITAKAQKVVEPIKNPDWEKTYQPFRIIGNLYYVGTYELGCYLITSSKGNILINTGVASSYAPIKNNIQKLGFRLSDIKILLTNQAHFDHVGAMAAIKKATGAKFFADAKDANALENGGRTDYELGKYGVSFKPVKADRLLNDGDSIVLGDVKIYLLHHPGHTKGSCSFLLTIKDKSKHYKVLIANVPTIITNRRFDEIKDYADIQKDYAYTLNAMQSLGFDIWVAAHASQFDLHEKRKSGDPYNPSLFMDRAKFVETINSIQAEFNRKIGMP